MPFKSVARLATDVCPSGATKTLAARKSTNAVSKINQNRAPEMRQYEINHLPQSQIDFNKTQHDWGNHWKGPNCQQRLKSRQPNWMLNLRNSTKKWRILASQRQCRKSPQKNRKVSSWEIDKEKRLKTYFAPIGQTGNKTLVKLVVQGDKVTVKPTMIRPKIKPGMIPGEGKRIMIY